MKKGFLSGYPGNVFKPAQAITRAQAMTVVANAQGLANDDAVTDSDVLLQEYFTDASALPNYARSLVATAAAQGSLVNYPAANQLRPNANLTRGEATALLCRQNAAGTDARYYVPAQYVAGWNTASDGEVDSGSRQLLPDGAPDGQGQLFFSGSGHEGRELWKTDGSVAGTHPVIDLIPGVFYRPKSCPAPPPELNNEDYCPPDELPIDSLPRSLTVHGDWLYFISDNGDIFRTDGTAKGIQHIHRFEGWPYNDFPPNMVRLGERLLVMGVADDIKLWALPE